MGEEKRVTKKGFTLVEILVATTILVIAMASIYMSFKGGVTAWSKGTARMKTYLNARGALDMMSREISAAFIYSTNNEFFYGQKFGGNDYLNFVAVAREAINASDLCTLSYFVASNELYRTDQPSVGTNITSVTGTPVPLASSVTGLSLQYYDGSQWQPNWDSTGTVKPSWDSSGKTEEGKLPQAVKIEITMQNEKKTSQSPGPKFSTVVFIPASRGQ